MNTIEREFDGLAAGYETNRLAPWYKAHAEAILRECPSPANGDILDVGCGTGYLVRSFLERSAGARGVGVDISPEMVAQAGRRAQHDGVRNAQFLQADWESFETRRLAGYSFRFVFCTNAFHYFSAPRKAARKLHDVLADGGTLYVLERNKSDSFLTLLWGWLHRHCIRDHVEFYTVEELAEFFEEAGFKEVTVARTIKRLFWKNKLYTSIVLLQCVKN